MHSEFRCLTRNGCVSRPKTGGSFKPHDSTMAGSEGSSGTGSSTKKPWLSKHSSRSYGDSDHGKTFAANFQDFLEAVEQHPEKLERDVSKLRAKFEKDLSKDLGSLFQPKKELERVQTLPRSRSCRITPVGPHSVRTAECVVVSL